jgi:hypothetical protein
MREQRMMIDSKNSEEEVMLQSQIHRRIQDTRFFFLDAVCRRGLSLSRDSFHAAF